MRGYGKEDPYLPAVVPVFNEEKNLTRLADLLLATLESTGLSTGSLIYVRNIMPVKRDGSAAT